MLQLTPKERITNGSYTLMQAPKKTEWKVLDWVKEVKNLVREKFVTSMDADGTQNGFDVN